MVLVKVNHRMYRTNRLGFFLYILYFNLNNFIHFGSHWFVKAVAEWREKDLESTATILYFMDSCL